MARIYAGILGPLAFVACLARGVVHAWPVEKTLLVAWASMLAFALLGAVVGRIAEWIVEDEVRAQLVARSETAKMAASASTRS